MKCLWKETQFSIHEILSVKMTARTNNNFLLSFCICFIRYHSQEMFVSTKSSCVMFQKKQRAKNKCFITAYWSPNYPRARVIQTFTAVVLEKNWGKDRIIAMELVGFALSLLRKMPSLKMVSRPTHVDHITWQTLLVCSPQLRCSFCLPGKQGRNFCQTDVVSFRLSSPNMS